MVVREQCSELLKLISLKGKEVCKPFAVRDGNFGIGGLIAAAKEGERLGLCLIFEVVRFYGGAQRGLFYTDQAICGEGGEDLLTKAAELTYEIFVNVTKKESEKVREYLKEAFEGISF